MKRAISILAGGVVLLWVLLSGPFAVTQTVPATLDADGRAVAVRNAAELMRNRYVFPDIGERTAAALESALDDGQYDNLDTHRAFAARLTQDLRAVANDKHLRVTPPAVMPGATRQQAPAQAPAQAAPPQAQGGIARADIIDGDVGYLEVIAFPLPFAFEPPADRAMEALRDTRALIVDIRRNGGGSPESVTHLVSYFIDSSEPVHVNTFINRKPGTETFTSTEFWSEATPVSYAGKPVYVLTSDYTFSGGEEFAYDMQAMGLATLVGETTGGGANPGGNMPIGAGLTMFVPGGRAENAITGTNWEGVGVTPDIDVPGKDALRVALEQLGAAPAVANIDIASTARVFSPAPLRTEPQPGTADAVRRMSDEAARGAPDFDLVSPQIAEVWRDRLQDTQNRYRSLGRIEAIDFVRATPDGADVFRVRYANGTMLTMIGLDANGRTVMFDTQPMVDRPSP